MIISRLIELLQELPQNAFVLVNDSENGSFPCSKPYITDDDFYTKPCKDHGITAAICLIDVREWHMEDEG